MSARDKEGAFIDAEFIRPKWWIDRNGIEIGAELPININELGLAGLATITDLDECPPLASGSGNVVTGRFRTSQVDILARVEILGPDGAIEILEGTTVHPVWSIDRNDWVPLSDLIDGEQLQSQLGPATVLSIHLSHSSAPVYNIEVHGEHVYAAGELGLLVHNACPLPILGRPPHGGSVHNSTMVNTALDWVRRGLTNVRTNQALSDGVRTISNLRPDVQGISNGLIHIAEVNVSGGKYYHFYRELLFRSILGSRFGSYTPL